MRDVHNTLCGNASPGSGGISYIIIRHISEESVSFLLIIYDIMWETSFISASWKLAAVIPILKTGKNPSIPFN